MPPETRPAVEGDHVDRTVASGVGREAPVGDQAGSESFARGDRIEVRCGAFIEFLEDLERNQQIIAIPRADVESLVARFGAEVRQMGVWHHTTDGSLEVPVANIVDAARSVGHSVLTEAVRQLKSPEEFTGMLSRSCAAVQFIEELGKLHREQFEKKIQRYQDAKDPAEVHRLASEISQELFGN